VNAAHYDPELPFLEKLEWHVRARAEHEAREARARPANPRAARISARAGGPLILGARAARITRRTAILVGLLCLIAATALAAGTGLFTPGQSPVVNHQGAFVLVASGHDGIDDWTLDLYVRNGQLCRALAVSGQAEASRCAPDPAVGAIGASGLQGAQHSYLFGVAGARVQAVRVRAGSVSLTVKTGALGGERARAAGLPSSARYFVAVLSRPLGGADPVAKLTALGAANRRVGRSQLACLEEAAAPPCGP
jgi:hypothetical protein